MGILGFLTREKSAAPPTVEELEERLARLGIERRRLVEGQAERARRRRELLTIDETDVEIFENERDSDAASLALERLDETEPLLLSELSAARGRRRQAEWEKSGPPTSRRPRASFTPPARRALNTKRSSELETKGFAPASQPRLTCSRSRHGPCSQICSTTLTASLSARKAWRRALRQSP